MHLGFFKRLKQICVATQDVEHLFHVLHTLIRITYITMAHEEFGALVLAERFAIDNFDLVRIYFTEHFQEDAALTLRLLADTDVV